MKFNRYIICLLIAGLPNAYAENIRISFGETLPPWVLNDGKDGILIELLTACLKPSGHTISVELFPYARRLTEYKNKNVDAVTDVSPANIADAKIQGYFTGNIYAYTNYFYSLANNNFQINSMRDIEKHSLISWQGATTVLGEAYQEMAKNNPNYREIDRQETQVRMLATNRSDFIQMDAEIFNYYRAKLANEKKIDDSLEYDRFDLLGFSPNGVLFRSQKVRDDCVRNLEALPMDHPIRAIINYDS
jgi:polar amino acid transport system substrate-binding protein